MITKWLIRYGLGGGFGGCKHNEWEEIEADNYDDAMKQAWEAACDEYDSYDGMHGLRTVEEIMEEDEVDEEEAEEIWRDDRESWLDYEAKKVINHDH